MKVAFLLGNGFDKAIGLKTGYNDFYKWYLEQSNNSDETRKLKDAIRKSRDAGDKNWADFEIALGKFTGEFDDKDKFISCFKSAKVSLMQYLEEVYNNIKLNDNDFLMSAAYGLDELSQMFYKDFEETEKGKFEKIVSTEDIVINYISFNYTPFLEEGNSDMISFANGFGKNLMKIRNV